MTPEEEQRIKEELESKKARLEKYKTAYDAIVLGEKKLSYSVGTRSATDFASRIDKLEKEIKKLEQEIAVLEGRSLRYKYDFRPSH